MPSPPCIAGCITALRWVAIKRAKISFLARPSVQQKSPFRECVEAAAPSEPLFWLLLCPPAQHPSKPPWTWHEGFYVQKQEIARFFFDKLSLLWSFLLGQLLIFFISHEKGKLLPFRRKKWPLHFVHFLGEFFLLSALDPEKMQLLLQAVTLKLF